MEKRDEILKEVAKSFLKEKGKEADILLITNYDELLRRWQAILKHVFAPEFEIQEIKKIEARMNELNEICTDYDELLRRWEKVEMWENASSKKTEPRIQIEARMNKLNRACTDYDELLRRWKKEVDCEYDTYFKKTVLKKRLKKEF